MESERQAHRADHLKARLAGLVASYEDALAVAAYDLQKARKRVGDLEDENQALHRRVRELEGRRDAEGGDDSADGAAAADVPAGLSADLRAKGDEGA